MLALFTRQSARIAQPSSFALQCRSFGRTAAAAIGLAETPKRRRKKVSEASAAAAEAPKRRGRPPKTTLASTRKSPSPAGSKHEESIALAGTILKPVPQDAFSGSLPSPKEALKTILPVIVPASPFHNDLASYLRHTEISGLSRTTTYFQGTHYEYIVQIALSSFGFALTRVGGSSDNGADLLGYWSTLHFHEPMRVLIQTKCRVGRVKPAEIRELDGAFNGVPAAWRDHNVMGIIVSPTESTSGVRKTMSLSKHALGYLMISREGDVGQFIWNQAAQERGLEGFGVTTQYVPGEDGSKEMATRVTLSFNGQPIPPVDKSAAAA